MYSISDVQCIQMRCREPGESGTCGSKMSDATQRILRNGTDISTQLDRMEKRGILTNYMQRIQTGTAHAAYASAHAPSSQSAREMIPTVLQRGHETSTSSSPSFSSLLSSAPHPATRSALTRHDGWNV